MMIQGGKINLNSYSLPAVVSEEFAHLKNL